MSEQANSRITILYVTSDFGVGGTEFLLVKLLRGLDRKRFHPIVACFRRRGPLLNEVLSLDVEVVEFDIPKRLTAPCQFFRLVRFMRRRKVHIVHAMIGSTKVYAALAGWLAGVPVLICSRLNMGYWAGPFGRWVVDFLMRRVYHGIIVNSRMIRDDLVAGSRVPKEKIRIVYNGVDIALFSAPVDIPAKKADLGIPDGRLVFGTVATLRPIKGLHILLEAARIVLEKHPQAYFVIVGDGPCRGELETLAESLGIHERVTFCGSRSDISEILAVFDVFVLSSLSEGLPNTVCEALARGVPVVAANVGGVGEAVLDGHTGLLVPPNDARALAESALSLTSESMREAMGAQGRRLAREKFSLDGMIENIEEVYEYHLKKLAEENIKAVERRRSV